MNKKYIIYPVVFIGIILAFIAYAIYVGFVISELWLWFVVPFGIKPITIGGAIGLSILISLIKGYTPVPQEVNGNSQIISIVLAPLISYLIGLFVHKYFILVV